MAALIKSFAENKNLDDLDINYLASCSVDDYYSFFVSEKSEMFYYYIKASLEVRRYAGVNHNAIVASDKAKEALLRIAAESKYNWLRLKYMRDLDLDLSDEYLDFLLLNRLLQEK